MTEKEITLIPREYSSEKKCPMCSYRTVVLWNLGEDEREEYAACGSCTTMHLASNDEYTILKQISESQGEETG